MTSIAERLKQAREDAGLTQPALAVRAGVSQGTIGNIEAGIRKRPRDLISIATVLGVNPLWLETGKGPRQVGEKHDFSDESKITNSLNLFAISLQNSDEITRDQVRLLLDRLTTTPVRASEIVPRISALLTREHALA